MAKIKAGVLGDPITHSLSPLIHGYWIEKYQLDGQYDALHVPHDHLPEKITALISRGYNGFNVTLPHKQAAVEICDELDNAAQIIGAVNTLIWQKGKLLGSNTDAYGFIANIKEQRPDFDFKAGPALVLGAGGAARAVIYSLKEAGVPEIRISNRTREKAEQLAREFGGRVLPWEVREKGGEGVNLLVNTTALGMTGKPALSFDLAHVPQTALVSDIVYNPLQTVLLKEAAARGNRTVDGLGMLLHQAVPGFEAWFGVKPAITPDLRSLLLEAL